jgi:type III pantothenate kinase
MNLVIDIGNSRIKCALFGQDKLVETRIFEYGEEEAIPEWAKPDQVKEVLLSSVSGKEKGVENALRHAGIAWRKLGPDTPLPFSSMYLTPGTLGMDRVAGIAGALFLHPGLDVLVIDAGTCITFDFLNAEGRHLGGSISPGLHMRLGALSHFTGKLPLVPFREISDFIGNSTETAILAGVFYGLLGEINETISRYEERFGNIHVILCGGDTERFGKHLKKDIFAAPFLVLYGLNKILEFNVNKGP